MGLFGLEVSNNKYRENLKNENITLETNEQNLRSVSEVVNETINTMRSEVENSQKSSTNVNQSISQKMNMGDIVADGSTVTATQDAKITFSETTKMLSKVYQNMDLTIGQKVIAANAVELAVQQIGKNSSQQKNADKSATATGQSAYSGCPEGPIIGTSVCNSDVEKNIMNYNENQIRNIVNNSVENSTIMKTDNAVESVLRILQVVNVAAHMAINQEMNVGNITALNKANVTLSQAANLSSTIAKDFESLTGVDLKRYLEGSTVSDSYNKLVQGQYTENDAKQDNEAQHKAESTNKDNTKILIIVIGVILGVLVVGAIIGVIIYLKTQGAPSPSEMATVAKLVGGVIY